MGGKSHAGAYSPLVEILPIVESDPATTALLLIALEPTGLTPVHFDSGESFLASDAAEKANCAVCDIQLPGISGIEIVKRIRGRNPACKFVLLTQSPRTELIVEAMRSGAVGVLEIPCSPHSLCSAVAEAQSMANSDPVVANRVLEHRKRLATLSIGERQVLAKLVDGVAHKKIASELDVGLRTVELRKSRIMKKVGVATVAELIQVATVVRVLDSTPTSADSFRRPIAGSRGAC